MFFFLLWSLELNLRCFALSPLAPVLLALPLPLLEPLTPVEVEVEVEAREEDEVPKKSRIDLRADFRPFSLFSTAFVSNISPSSELWL
jgi:hypothetical protein